MSAASFSALSQFVQRVTLVGFAASEGFCGVKKSRSELTTFILKSAGMTLSAKIPVLYLAQFSDRINKLRCAVVSNLFCMEPIEVAHLPMIDRRGTGKKV